MNVQQAYKSLTPADIGILAATFDSCIGQGLGDDDTTQTVADMIEEHDMASGMMCWELASHIIDECLV